MSIFTRSFNPAVGRTVNDQIATENLTSATANTDGTTVESAEAEGTIVAEGEQPAAQEETQTETQEEVQEETQQTESQEESQEIKEDKQEDEEEMKAKSDEKTDDMSSEAITASSDPVPTPSAPVVLRVRHAGRTHGVMQRMMDTAKLDRRTAELQSQLADHAMVNRLSAVASEHQLSAPLVAAFRAAPNFDQAVKNFPATSLFNVIPEHAMDVNNIAGMESLSGSEIEFGNVISAKTTDVVDTFKTILTNMAPVIADLKQQVEDSAAALEASDVTDEVMASLQVTTLSSAAFTASFAKIADMLKEVDAFDAEHLQANPEKVSEEIQGLEALVGDVGEMFGLKATTYGLASTDRSAVFEPSAGTFADKDISKSTLSLYLSQSDDILSTLKVISDNQQDIVTSLDKALTEMPATLSGDDVNYGGADHAKLLSSYTMFVNKLMTEAVMTVSTLLGSVDEVLDIDDGM